MSTAQLPPAGSASRKTRCRFASSALGLILSSGVICCSSGCSKAGGDDGAHPLTPPQRNLPPEEALGSQPFWSQMFDSSPFDIASAVYEVREPGIAVIDLEGFGKGAAPVRRVERVAAVIGNLFLAGDGEREDAAITLGEVCFGFEFMAVRHCWPDAEELAVMREAVRRGWTGSRQAKLVPLLIRALDDSSPRVREAVVYSLLHIGPVAVEACPRLRKALFDDDHEVRGWSARALYTISADVPVTLRANLELLNDADPRVRILAANNVLLMGDDGHAAIPILRALTDDPVEDVQSYVRSVLDSLAK